MKDLCSTTEENVHFRETPHVQRKQDIGRGRGAKGKGGTIILNNV